MGLDPARARGADAANVLVFNSTRFVDSQQGAAYPVGSQESDNVQAAVRALGHTVTTIAGPNDPVGSCSFGYSQPGTVLATAMQYQSALASADVFLIPEQESWCYLPGELFDHSDIVAVWRNWVAGGGGLVIHSSNEAKTKVADLFDVVFGLRGIGGVNGTGVTTTKRAAAQGTQFANGPATLAGNESSGAIPPATLPPGALSIYDDGTNASVVIIPFGAGKIVFLGWDWTKSDPPFTGDGQIGGWYPLVLDGAVKEAASMVLTVAMTGSGAGTVTSSTPAFDSPHRLSPDLSRALPARRRGEAYRHPHLGLDLPGLERGRLHRHRPVLAHAHRGHGAHGDVRPGRRCLRDHADRRYDPDGHVPAPAGLGRRADREQGRKRDRDGGQLAVRHRLRRRLLRGLSE